jgi:flagellar motor component MotA
VIFSFYEEDNYMTHDEFIAEYYKFSARAIYLSEKARRQGLLALEDEIDTDKIERRDIFELGINFVVDGTDIALVREIMSNIIIQEEDKYARIIKEMKAAAVISIQAGENTRILASKLNSLTDIAYKDDPVFQKFKKKDNDTWELSEAEIDTLIGGLK